MAQPQDSTPNQPSQTALTVTAAAAAVTALYIWAEMRVVTSITKGLRSLAASHGWISPISFLTSLRQTKNQVFNQLEKQTPILLDQLEKSILTAEPIPTIHIPPPQGPINLGKQQGGGDDFDFTKPLAERAIEAIRTDLSNELKDARFRILRVDDDIYKWLGAGAAQDADKDSGRTVRQAMRTMYNELLAHGVTGFTDKGGRDWSLSSYVEMAVRTESARGLRDAHMQVMQAAGIHLFIVPTQSHPCPKCFAWQGKVLSVEPDKRADATIEEATIGGLWHPNCEHHLSAYIPGHTKRPKPREWTERDEAQWKATQKQRSLEVKARKTKRLLAASSDPELSRGLRSDSRATQQQIRDLTAEHRLLRRRQREQVNLGLHK
ncbi:MAG: phage minor capsid protein [Bifidobacteriaceae bacterium]|jgi:hypothetical protein|nr:phage minor capsid protein [Bifidobacteriaceae bacterium]